MNDRAADHGHSALVGVRCEIADSVATVALTSPAMTRAVRQDLLRLVDAIGRRDDVDAVILTGTGRIFCAGQDLAEHGTALAADPQTAVDSLDDEYAPIIRAVTDLPCPVIAAINGSCAGGGLGLALAADLRVAAADARFTPAFLAIGLAPDCGVSVSLARAVGATRASEILLRNLTFSATEAWHWGLVGSVVPIAELHRTATSLAATLATRSRDAVLASRRLLREGWGRSLDEALDAESRAQHQLAKSRAHSTAVSTLIEMHRASRRSTS